MSTFDQKSREVGDFAYRVIRIHGECGLSDVDDLQVVLESSDGTEEGVVISLEDCEFIDSMALAALVRAHDRIDQDGGHLVMAAPSDQVRRVLRVSRLDTDGLVFDSIEEAVAGSRGPLRLV